MGVLKAATGDYKMTDHHSEGWIAVNLKSPWIAQAVHGANYFRTTQWVAG